MGIDSEYKHFFFFEFDKEITDKSKIKCPECQKWINVDKWIHTESYCDICGDHPSLMCPECLEVFDHVYTDDEFNVK